MYNRGYTNNSCSDVETELLQSLDVDEEVDGTRKKRPKRTWADEAQAGFPTLGPGFHPTQDDIDENNELYPDSFAHLSDAGSVPPADQKYSYLTKAQALHKLLFFNRRFPKLVSNPQSVCACVLCVCARV